LQRAAEGSRTYFENTRRYLDFEPEQFAFRLLTRSGRVTYDNLRMRDLKYLESMERWYGKRAMGGANGAPAMVVQPPMLTPLRLAGMTIPNRAVASVVSSGRAEDGTVDECYREQLIRSAQGGAGVVMTGIGAVSHEGRITPGCLGLYTDDQQDRLARAVEEIHRPGTAKVALQLGHAGRRGATRPRWEGLDRPLLQGSWPLRSASPIPYSKHSHTPKEMDADAMADVRKKFAQAAQRAASAGVDLLQLHFAHGYLVASFLSPLTNQRKDRYGGTLENRMRYPLEVFDAVREAWPEGRPLGVAINATDWAKGGSEIGDAVIVARALKEHGCDLVAVLAGQTVIDEQPQYGPGYLTDFSDCVRNEAGIATMTAGQLTSTDQINTIIAGGRADLCVIDFPV
jgi:anthraniloyl-CoA monooxygenase